jgi:predicted permease
VELNFLSLLGVVAPVFVIIAAGVGLRRVGWLTAEADTSLLRVSFNFLYPCLIADKSLGNTMLNRADNILIPPLVGFGSVALGLVLAALVARVMRLPDPSARAFTFTTALQNWGYLPLPIVLALFPGETLGVLFTFNFGVEIALWTVGIWMLSGRGGRAGWRNIVNAPLCALLASILLNAMHAATWLPRFALDAMHMIGETAVPAGLILTGAVLADLLAEESSVAAAMRPGILSAACILRLGILPLAMLACARWLPLTRELQQIVVVQAAMPTAMLPIILARLHGADSALALGIVLTTTAISLITIPAWLHFGAWWVGI